MPKLQILSGVLEGKVIDLIEERITVGRAVDNTIRLEDGTVSHHHAVLVLDGSDYKLRDLNSTNGTRVNGLRIVESQTPQTATRFVWAQSRCCSSPTSSMPANRCRRRKRALI